MAEVRQNRRKTKFSQTEAEFWLLTLIGRVQIVEIIEIETVIAHFEKQRKLTTFETYCSNPMLTVSTCLQFRKCITGKWRTLAFWRDGIWMNWIWRDCIVSRRLAERNRLHHFQATQMKWPILKYFQVCLFKEDCKWKRVAFLKFTFPALQDPNLPRRIIAPDR